MLVRAMESRHRTRREPPHYFCRAGVGGRGRGGAHRLWGRFLTLLVLVALMLVPAGPSRPSSRVIQPPRYPNSTVVRTAVLPARRVRVILKTARFMVVGGSSLVECPNCLSGIV